MRNNSFNKEKKFYHLNLDFETQPLFRQLDWIYIQKKIQNVAESFKIEIHCLIMLDTHVHLIIGSESKNENYFCEYFQKEISPKQKTDCFCEPILDYSQYLNTYKYVYRNALEVGLCDKVEDYPYSSLRIILGFAVGYVLIDDSIGLIQNPIQILKWLNSAADFKNSQLKLLRQDNSLSI